MKTFLKYLVPLFICFAITVNALETDGEILAQRESHRRLFRATAANLDLGGDMFIYLNTEDLFRHLLQGFVDMLALFADEDPDAKEAAEIFGRMHGFMEKTGMYDMRAMGISSMLRRDGQYNFKTFLSRKPSDEPRLFWDMFGGEARKLQTLQMIPASAEITWVSECTLQDVWKFIVTAISDIGGEEGREEIEYILEDFKDDTGYDLEQIIASVGDEFSVSLILSPDKMMAMPPDAGIEEMPEPGVLVTMKVRNSTIQEILLNMFIDMEIPLQRENFAGHTIYSFPEEPDAPFAFQPSMVVKNEFLMLASSPDILKASIEAERETNGLIARSDVRKLMTDMPSEMNSFFFLSERVSNLAEEAFKQMMGETEDSPEAMLSKQFVQWFKPSPIISIRANSVDGIFTSTISSHNGRQMLVSMTSLPVAIVSAGIMLPAITNARGMGEEMALKHNLYMIESAKHQWSMEHAKTLSDTPTEDDLKPYMGGQLPPLPDGWRYVIGSMGEYPYLISTEGETITID